MNPLALTIGAADPTGRAGMQTDVLTFGAHKVRATCVVTATSGPSELYALPTTAVAAQLSLALREAPPVAVKVGMLATAEIAAAVLVRARAGDLPNLVLDPDLGARGGFHRGVIGALMRLVPMATLVTPDIDEASALVGWPIVTTADMAGAAAQLAASGAKYVVITGGRLGGDESVDAVWTSAGARFLRSPRVDVVDTRGAGTMFSAAITARLSQGIAIGEAVTGAKEYVTRALCKARSAPATRELVAK